MDLNKQRRFIFTKEYKTDKGSIPEGSQLDEFRGMYYFNGGLCDTYSTGLFEYMLNNHKLRQEYLTEVKIIENKV
jgi:hypothetical protein